MKAFVNGEPASLESFGLPPTNFGQPRPGVPLVRYEFILSRAELLQLLEKPYCQFAREIRSDIEIDNDLEDAPELQRLHKLDFPPLSALLEQDPSVVGALLQKWIHLESLDAVSRSSLPLSGPLYAFKSIDQVDVSRDEIRFHGKAFHVRS